MAYLNLYDRNTEYFNVYGNVFANVKLFKGLSYRFQYSFERNHSLYTNFLPEYESVFSEYNMANRESKYNTTTQLSKNNGIVFNSIIENQLNYDVSFGKHALNAMLATSYERYTSETANAFKSGGPGNDDAFRVLDSQTTGDLATGTKAENVILSYLGRINYNYNDTYLATVSFRADGSSRFAKGNRWGYFPSFSLGWRLSEEQFMENTRHWLDNLKVRGSWGSLGNQDVANYAYIASYGAPDYIYWVMNGEQLMGMSPTAIIANDLTWETVTTLDFGIDASVLNNRLEATFDWYTRRTTDILMDGTKLPAVLGASVPKRNSGELKTNGWELSLKWRDQLANGIRYDVGFVLSDYQSEVISFTGNPNKLLSSLYDGMKMGEIWGYETVGILQEDDFTIDENGKYILIGPDQSKVQSTIYPGDVRYADLDGNGEISPGSSTVDDPGDRKIIGNSTPRFQYGITGNISWKNFDLNIFFQGIGTRDIWISDNVYWGGSGTAGNWEMYNNSWTPERTDAKFPMYAGRISSITQSGYLINAAYLRLKTLSLGYTLPKAWTDKVKLSNVRLSLAGYNLFEITQVPDLYDPDQISSAYPMMRSVAFGVQVGF